MTSPTLAVEIDDPANFDLDKDQRLDIIKNTIVSLKSQKYSTELQIKIQNRIFKITEGDLREGIKKQIDNMIKQLEQIEVALQESYDEYRKVKNG